MVEYKLSNIEIDQTGLSDQMPLLPSKAMDEISLYSKSLSQNTLKAINQRDIAEYSKLKLPPLNKGKYYPLKW